MDAISNLLMEEGVEDAPAACIHHDGNASYQAIFRSFHDIICEPPPPKSSLVSATFHNLFDEQHVLHIPPQIVDDDEQHVLLLNGFDIFTHQMLHSGASTVLTLPANANLHQEETADTSLLVPAPACHVICLNSANLNALSAPEVQDYHAAIKFSDGELLDTNVSFWETYKGLNNFTSCSGRGSNAHSQLPSPYKEFSLQLAGVELSFEDLTLHDLYAGLYVGQPVIPTGAPKYANKEKGIVVAGKDGKSSRKRTADHVDFRELIVNCAQAVAVGNIRAANELLQVIRKAHGASADGNGPQRAAHYFSEALEARMRGTGGHHFRAILDKKPSAMAILKSYKLCLEVIPLMKTAHYFANQSILKAAERASRLHIVDYGFDFGLQWPFLILALADQKGGPPSLVITGINFPQPGNNPAGRLEECGWRLAAHARTYNVPFQYHVIASSKWEDLNSSSFHFHEDEVLVVNCIKSLRHLTDESVDLVSPRQKFLTCIRSLKPHLLITADVSVAYNSSFFVSRFREALYYYSNVYDMFDTLLGNSPERLLKERAIYGDILNIVACEGAERVERAETYRHWQVHIKRAGFEQLLIPPSILSRSRSHVKQQYHKEFFVHDDANKWMLLGWRGRTSVAISAWKLSHAQ